MHKLNPIKKFNSSLEKLNLSIYICRLKWWL